LLTWKSLTGIAKVVQKHRAAETRTRDRNNIRREDKRKEKGREFRKTNEFRERSTWRPALRVGVTAAGPFIRQTEHSVTLHMHGLRAVLVVPSERQVPHVIDGAS
jgi:hypothetical protein